MYRTGHYGAALLVYAPVGLALLLAGMRGFAVLGGAVTVALARAPDYDLVIPFVSHRGSTHTLAFAVLVGAATGAVGWALAEPLGADPVALAALGAGAATCAVISHLLADALTPAGVRPLWPLSNREYSLGLVQADNWLANQALLALGVLAVALVVVAR